MGQQLATLDQPIAIGTRVKMVGHGIILFCRNIGRRLALRYEIDTRLVSADVTSRNIPIRLEVSPDEGAYRPIKRMMVPLSLLVALVVDCEVFIRNLR
jgi:hypothetical protein